MGQPGNYGRRSLLEPECLRLDRKERETKRQRNGKFTINSFQRSTFPYLEFLLQAHQHQHHPVAFLERELIALPMIAPCARWESVTFMQ